MTTDSKVRTVVSVTFDGGPLHGQTKRVPADNPHMAPLTYPTDAFGKYKRVGMSKNMEWEPREIPTILPKTRP